MTKEWTFLISIFLLIGSVISIGLINASKSREKEYPDKNTKLYFGELNEKSKEKKKNLRTKARIS